MHPALKLVLINAAIQFFTTTAILRMEFHDNHQALEALYEPVFFFTTLTCIVFGSLLRALDLGKHMANIVFKWHARDKFIHKTRDIRYMVYRFTDFIFILMAVVRVIVYRHTEMALENVMIVNCIVFLFYLGTYVVFEPCLAFLFVCFFKLE